MAYKQKSAAEYAAQRQQQLDELHATVQKIGNDFSENPEDIADFLRFRARFHQYSTNNTMLIYAQNPHAMFVGSFLKYKELGYAVKAGEHGMKILTPTPVTLWRENEAADWKQLSVATPAQKEKVKSGEYPSRQKTRFKVGTVFDISQTNCPVEDYPKLCSMGYTSDQHAAIFKGLKSYCISQNLPVDEKDLKSIALRGQYNPSENTITINELLQDTQKLSTLAHEFGHAILHNRTTLPGHRSVAQKELEADATGMMIESQFGIDPTDRRRAHLASCYKSFVEEVRARDDYVQGDELLELDKVLRNVTEMYNQHRDGIEAAVQQELAEPLSQTQEKTGSTSGFAAENAAVPTEREKNPKVTLQDSDLVSVTPAQRNYRFLADFCPQIMTGEYTYMRFESAGFEPLSIENIGDGQISVMHTYVQNGDLMRDPEIVLQINGDTANAISYQLDGLGLYQSVDKADGGINLRLQRDLNETFVGWAENITVQGYIPVNATRSIRGEEQDITFDRELPMSDETVNQAVAEQVQRDIDQMPRVFVDMDGTLANFHQENNYIERMYEPEFFQNLEPYQNAVYGLQEYMLDHPDTEVFTLSAAVDSATCVSEKGVWLDRYLPEIDAEHRVFVPFGEDKTKYIPGGIRRNDILIDDYNKNLADWRQSGGYAVKFVNDINDRGLRGARFEGQRVHYASEPYEISAQISSAVSVTQTFQTQQSVYYDRDMYAPGQIVKVNMRLEDGNLHNRYMLITAVDPYDVVYGYNITSVVGCDGSRKAQYITNVPLINNDTNGLKMPSCVKMNTVYAINADQVILVAGTLTEAERQLIELHKGIYAEANLCRANLDLNVSMARQMQQAFLAAVRNNDLTAAAELLAKGADAALAVPHTGNTPLHYAARFASPEMCSKLLDAGAPVNAVSEKGKTALQIAARGGDPTMVGVLLDAGADPALTQLTRQESKVIDAVLEKQQLGIKPKGGRGLK